MSLVCKEIINELLIHNNVPKSKFGDKQKEINAVKLAFVAFFGNIVYTVFYARALKVDVAIFSLCWFGLHIV